MLFLDLIENCFLAFNASINVFVILKNGIVFAYMKKYYLIIIIISVIKVLT